jgi:ABC-2 type transport system permease protein
MGIMLRLSLRQLAGRRRLILILVLAAIPVALAIVLKIFASEDVGFKKDFIDSIIDGIVIASVMPIVVMTLATAAFGHELEDRTLNVLVLKPVARSAIVLSKLLASIAIAAPIVVIAGTAVTLIAVEEGGGRAAVAVIVALFAGVVAYSSLFTWAGLMTSRALGFALVYVLLWEGLITSFLSGVRYLSIRSYTLGILHGIDEKTFGSIGERVIELPAAAVGATAVTIVFTLLTIRRLQRMDVP